jgi:hypothetical protein
LLLSLNKSSARAKETCISSGSATLKQIFMTRFIRIIPIDCSSGFGFGAACKIVAKMGAGNHKVIGGNDRPRKTKVVLTVQQRS